MYTSDGRLLGDDGTLLKTVTEKYGIDEAEPDLDLAALQETLKGMVEVNKIAVRRRRERSLSGAPIQEVPLSESGMSRNFWGRIKGAKYRFALQDGTWDFF